MIRFRTLFGFILMSLLFVACKHNGQYKKYKHAQAEYAPFDAIIVPGVPFEGDKWKNAMKLRVYWAKYLWDQGMTKNIIFSGGAVYTEYCEAKIMKLYAIEMGIPAENLFCDTLAQHSTENVYYGYWLAVDQGFDKLALASDKYQTNGLKSFVKRLNRKYDTDMQVLPAMHDTLLSDEKPDYDINADLAKETTHFVNIKETQGLLYRLAGTMGQHIDWKNRPISGDQELSKD